MSEKPDTSTRVPPSANNRWIVAVGAAIVGLCYAGVVSLLAVFMYDRGHGWTSASISCVGLILIPLASVACVYRHAFAANLLGGIALVCAGVADIYLFNDACNEGFEGFTDAYGFSLRLFVLVWAILWCAWQVAIAVLFLRRFRFRFGLRSLFVLVTVMCVWLGYSMNWIRERQSIRTAPDTYASAAAPYSRYAPAFLWLLGEPAFNNVELPKGTQIPDLDRAAQFYPEARILYYVVPTDAAPHTVREWHGEHDSLPPAPPG